MVTIICQVQMRVHDMQNLKEKRSVIRSIIERTKRQYMISIIESDFNDYWQKSELSFAFCSMKSNEAKKRLDGIIGFIESNPSVEIYDISREEVHM